MVKDSRRTKRVGVTIQRQIAELLIKGVKDPRLEGVTITHVLVTEDLLEARVYFFAPQGRNIADVLKGFQSAKGYLRAELGDSIKARRIPELIFIYDDSLDLFEKLGTILPERKDS